MSDLEGKCVHKRRNLSVNDKFVRSRTKVCPRTTDVSVDDKMCPWKWPYAASGLSRSPCQDRGCSKKQGSHRLHIPDGGKPCLTRMDAICVFRVFCRRPSRDLQHSRMRGHVRMEPTGDLNKHLGRCNFHRHGGDECGSPVLLRSAAAQIVHNKVFPLLVSLS